jgi:hypothetical protein
MSDDVSVRNPSEFKELDAYLTINACGAFIWRMKHDMCNGRIPQIEHAAIDEDVKRVKSRQLEIIKELPRFGVEPLDADGKATPAYWTWYETWDSWKNGLTNEKWQEVSDHRCTFTDEEVLRYKNEAFKQEPEVMKAKLLTTKEMELFHAAINWAVKCDPESTREEIAKKVASELSFKVDEDDIAEVCENVSGR